MNRHIRWARGLLATLLACGAGAFGVAALSADPASAASAAGGCTPKACAPVIDVAPMASDGSVQVTYADPGGGLESLQASSLSLMVTWAPQGPVPTGAPQPTTTSVKLTNGMCTGTGPITCTYAFPSDLQFGGFLLNGTYKLQASAKDCQVGLLNCTSTTTDPKLSSLANPATAPTAATATLDATSNTVKVSWTPSPEPDVAGYRVFRNDGTEACQEPTPTPAPTSWSCVDNSSGGGTFTYHVVAYRWGATYSSDPKLQPSSPASTPTGKVTVAGPPATTTTTVAGATTTTTLAPLIPSGFTGTPSPGKTGKSGSGNIHATPGPAAPGAVGSDTPAGPDPGFQPLLPYGARPSTTVAPDSAALSAPSATPHKGKTSVGSIAVIGAGLLVGVIALHGLWLRAEVRRGGPLEAIDPET